MQRRVASKKLPDIRKTFLALALNRIASNIHLMCLVTQFSSVAQSCLNLCNSMDCNTPGLPCPSPTPGAYSNSCPLSEWCYPTILSPSPPAFNLSQNQGLFQWISSLHQEAKVLEFHHQHQSFQWKCRSECLYNGLVGSPCSPGYSQESSPKPQFKSINSLALSFLYSPNSHIHTWPIEKP